MVCNPTFQIQKAEQQPRLSSFLFPDTLFHHWPGNPWWTTVAMADLQYALLNADDRPDFPQTSEGVSAPIPGNICGAAEACQRSFDSCIENTALEDFAAFFHSSYGEFNIWCFGMKAIASGKSSLDYRLRDHVKAQEEIRGLLLDLANSLGSCEQRAVCEYHLVASTYDANLLRSDESKQ